MVYTGADLENGSYAVTLDTGSSDITVSKSVLVASDGTLSLKVTLPDSTYTRAYAGTADEAAADSAQVIEAEAGDDGTVTFTIPINAVGSKFNVALESSWGMWTDTQMTVEADSLPEGAVKSTASEAYTTVEAAACPLKDGVWNVPVTLEGGSGRASVESPASVSVDGGVATADIKWSSNHYDYMIVNGEKYEPVTTDPVSEFEIPVVRFDEGYTVIADTTAMSRPYEIEYTLTFDSSSAEITGHAESAGQISPVQWVIAVAFVAVIAVISFKRSKKAKPAGKEETQDKA